MGVLTADITRLCSEIGAMRRARGALKKTIARGTKERRAAVSAMLAGLYNAHAKMARLTRANRMAFLSNLRQEVAGKRRDLISDLAGAHQAWCGWSSTRSKHEEAEAGRRAKLETRAELKKHEQPEPPNPRGAKSEGKREGAKPAKPMHFLRRKG